MGKKGRKFIDKRYDIVHSFKVVQRSQQDPLVADENAPQAVLVGTECSKEHEKELQKYGVYFDDDYDYLQHLRGVQESIDWVTCDLKVYTIREKDQKKEKKCFQEGLFLPSSAFESYIEEPVGLLNIAAPVTGPNVELDPDIVAQLDSDNESEYFDADDENGIPDDFISQLNQEGYEKFEGIGGEEGGGEFGSIHRWIGGTHEFYDFDPQTEAKYGDRTPLEESLEEEQEFNTCNNDGLRSLTAIEEESNETSDKVGDLPQGRMKRRKSRTGSSSRLSTSSSTLPRTELQRTYDAYFERIYKKEYSADKIGALDGEDIGGLTVNSPQFIQALKADKKLFDKPSMALLETDEKKDAIEWTKNNMKIRNEMQGEKEELVEIEMKPKLKHDLVSYLEAQARARGDRPKNLPNVIDHRNPTRAAALTKKAIKEHNQANFSDKEDSSSESSESDDGRLTLKSQISIFSQRATDESKEEKRQRKKGLKELRKMRRIEKKTSTLEFKELKKIESMKARNKGNFRVVSLSGLI